MTREPHPHRNMSHYVLALLAAAGKTYLPAQRDPRELKQHNVEECCQCGAKIGRGRDGRRCRACREVQQ